MRTTMGQSVMNYERLDIQMENFSTALATDVCVDSKYTSTLATSLAAEIHLLGPDDRARVANASPVSIAARLDELRAFQAWMELATNESNAATVRAQVIVQNYVCFVYLGEACFRELRKVSRAGSVTRRCCEYLTNDGVRAFRNAIAHANWAYAPDFSGLIYWARKDDDKTTPMDRFRVTQSELEFWQALSRTVAYVTYASLEGLAKTGH